MKPGDIDGRRGDSLRRFSHDGRLWHQHLEHREYRYKIVGKELWPLKEGEEFDPATIRTVKRAEIVGLELVSEKEHWWLDKEIERPDLQSEGWDFRTHQDGDCGPLVDLDYRPQKGKPGPHEWQIPWAWLYECYREWQPWSDFDRWRNNWRIEVKRLQDPSTYSFCGRRTLKETECDAANTHGGLLPLWLLRDFAEYFPSIPWVRIPVEKRNSLKEMPTPGSFTIPLEGALLELKENAPQTTGSPFDHEYLQRYRDWLDGPGYYEDEKVREFARGHFVGTYIISIPWNHTDTDLKDAFVAWLTKHAPKRGDPVRVHDQKGYRRERTTHDRETQELTGKHKPLAHLKQLGALRLWRDMKAEAAVGPTMPYRHKSSLLAAKNNADLNLAGFYGVA
jgi:hypothetical protein